MEQKPFSEAEKRWVLSEAIRTSSIPLEKLLLVLSDSNVTPLWEEMLLPQGRTLKACMDAFNAIVRNSPISSLAPIPTPSISTQASSSSHKRKSGPETFESFSAGPLLKRRQSAAESGVSTRVIQPKPALDGSPQPYSSFASQPPKKRGRPSKAEVEARNAEAIARGEVLPPSRTPGVRNPIQFDPRSPVQSEPAPSPKTLAPSLHPADDRRSFSASITMPGYSTLAASLPLGVDSNIGPFPTTLNTGGQMAAFAPMMMSPTSPGEVRTQDSVLGIEALTSSGKKKRVRPGSKTAKPPNIGESSFHTSNTQIGQFEPITAPVIEQAPKEQTSFPTTSEAEKPQPNVVQSSQAELPPSSQRSDI